LCRGLVCGESIPVTGAIVRPARRAHPTLIVLGGDATADDAALDAGSRWARAHESGVILFHAAADPHASVADLSRRQRRVADFAGGPAELAVSGRGPSLVHAIALAMTHRVGVIVVGAGGGRWQARVKALLHRAHVPVLVARSGGDVARIVVGSDLRDPHFPAIRAAAQEARCTGAALTLLHALEPRPAIKKPGRSQVALSGAWHDELVEAAERRLQRALWVADAWGEYVVAESVAALALQDLAIRKEANLLVVGTRRRRVGRRIAPGATALAVVHDAPCSVLVVPLPSHA
jgi:nucleotide-binding universal stress UspA family protein